MRHLRMKSTQIGAYHSQSLWRLCHQDFVAFAYGIRLDIHKMHLH